MRPMPTAPIAAGALLAGYAVVEVSGSRALGGAVLIAGGVWCMQAWRRRHGVRTAAALTCAGLAALVASHLLALAIGAWPAVLLVSLAMAVETWRRADARPAQPSFGSA